MPHIIDPNSALATVPCPCAALTHDTAAWCNACWLELCDLERAITPELPHDYTSHDVLVAALAQLCAGAAKATTNPARVAS